MNKKKSKIRLLFITGIFYPLMGGPTVALDTIIPELLNSEKIEEIAILTAYVNGEMLVDSKEYRYGKVKIYRLLIPRKSIFEGSKIYHKPFQGLRVFYNGMIIIVICLIDSIDVVHDVFRYEYLATKLIGAASIMDVRSLGREEPLFEPDSLIAISDKIYDMHGRWCGEDKISKIPIPLGRLDVGDEEVVNSKEKYGLEGRYLCFVGRLTYAKGIDLALEGFHKIREKYPDLSLVLIGDKNDLEDIVSADVDLKNVYILGEIDHQETLSLMIGSEAVILPSRKEGVPRVMLEALQLEKKVLAPNCVEEFKDQIPEFVLDENSPEAVEDGLDFIMETDSLPDYDLSVHAPEKVADRWIQIYEKTMEKR